MYFIYTFPILEEMGIKGRRTARKGGCKMKQKVVVRTEPIAYNRFGRTPEREFEFMSVPRAMEVALDFGRRGFIAEVLKGGEVIFSTL